ncbi:hypothetical protein TOPH_01771 [Tolypocladium ophioglossoides CBS 100239]|uniref:Protection of telomeres protein 1 n=1 Tax=Tolypocladium ophioglossoides (strain CBS 100239) TaxID=1163406 RepID=A0A0L0NID8_TOLOC|nr:hypothetical protein TOPH_01771 [Tolypocladium ophioglossoides CBS 100239]
MAQPGNQKLPSGFVTVRDLLDGKHSVGSKVNVIGVVTDFRAPIPTRGKDWKCQIRIYDQSIEYDSSESLLLNIFWSQENMPDAGCGDVIVILAAKVQQYHSESISLCTNWTTDIHMYRASKIPEPPKEASVALRSSNRKQTSVPSEAELVFVPVLYHTIDKERLPAEAEFEVMRERSNNVKDKFRELKDVRDGSFADTVVQIVRDPYDLGDKFTLWVSDYTENQFFFHFSFTGGNAAEGQVGDPFGYTAKFSNGQQKAEWTGPFGKRSMQVTCYEPHASVIRNQGLSNGSWVCLRNMQFKVGHNGSNLEGYLREDRGAHGIKINIVPLNPTEDPESVSPQLKNAIRRRRDYEKAKKGQLKDIAEAAKAGHKRKADMGLDTEEPPKMNAEARRRAKRAKKLKPAELEKPLIPVPDLSTQVKCENENKLTSFVAEILEPVYHETTIDKEAVKLQLPFMNASYRAHVRVVNFMPSKLEDFACPKKKASDYDVLSDKSGSESDSESGPDQDMMTNFTSVKDWEWHFYLELEDAVVKDGQQKKRVWVLVDDQAAQCLTSLDASNLRLDSKNLQVLRDRLFLLWGNLEEHKSQAVRKAKAGKHNEPPEHSSDEEDAQGKKTPQVSNRPVSCCIRQYGVKVSEPDARKANAGDGKRWQRMFGLFGTRIVAA